MGNLHTKDQAVSPPEGGFDNDVSSFVPDDDDEEDSFVTTFHGDESIPETTMTDSSLTQEEEEEDSTTSATSAAATTPPAHPLCSGWSWLMKRRPELFESLEEAHPNDDEITSCASVWTSERAELSSSSSSWSTMLCTPPSATPSRRRINSWLSFSSNSSTSSSSSMDVLSYTAQELELSATEPTPESNLRDPNRQVWIVTTAALPWMTGTAVNPLLRAAYLWQYRHEQQTMTTDNNDYGVHLVLPWLESASDRVALYGPDWRTATCQDQEAYIRTWLTDKAHMPRAAQHVCLHFYPARYHQTLSSIFAMGDVCAQFNNDDPNAILILEEPEHLNYYRAPQASWRGGHVIGICHTNYKYYAQQHVTGLVTAPLVAAVSAGLVRAYCDSVIKLSAVLQNYAPHKEVVCNVHGIRQDFFDAPAVKGDKIYFLGKLLWAKGLDHLLTLQEYYRQKEGKYFEMDIYGSGPEQEEIERVYLGGTNETMSAVVDLPQEDEEDESKGESRLAKIKRRGRRRGIGRLLNGKPLPVQFCGRIDHAAIGSDYKIFINPSVSEVLCTTTAEALAMGKFVILPRHASNTFFEDFDNALFYSTPDEFVAQLQYAQQHKVPKRRPTAKTSPLSWEAATERLLNVACVSQRDAARRQRLGGDDAWLAQLHYELGKGRTGDVLRKVLGGGPVADQARYQQQLQQRQMA